MMDTATWYGALVKPGWAPPPEVFGPVWAVLYVLIALSFGYVFYKIWKGEWPRRLAIPFALNLIFNLAFSPLQFGLQNNLLAAADILLILGTLAWALASVYRYARWVALINVPYFLWVSFATALQLTITWLN